MKKIIVTLLIVLAMALALTGCAGSDSGDDDIVVLTERFFVTQFSQIILNQQQYVGRTLQYEGHFRTVQGETRTFYEVYRYVVCCENKPFGFEIILGDIEPFEDNTWVELTGILENRDGSLVIRALSIRD